MALIKTSFPHWPDLSDFFSEGWMKERMDAKWLPAVNVIDHDSSYEIEVAAPGLKKDDFNIEIEHGVLRVNGRMEQETEKKEKNYVRKEFSARSFSKAFTLPDNVRDESVAAKYEDGVLRLSLKKSQPEESVKRTVAID